ncbi:uncharacterized protein LOC144440778 [Glandiceps talaboti]
MPATEDLLLMFIAYLKEDRNLKYNTILTYLYSVRSLHIKSGLPDPLKGRFRIPLAMRSVKRFQGPDSKQKLAITFDILVKLQPLYDVSRPIDLILWTAMVTAFFGLFRSGELVVKQLPFQPTVHLTVNDVSFTGTTKPMHSVAIIHLKQSKCDPFRKGVDVVVGCSGSSICAVDLLSRLYSQRIKAGASPNDALFLMPGNKPLTRYILFKSLKTSLSHIGLDSSLYSGHSFHSGGATSAAAAGISDWEIKVMGRWSSDCYRRYIRTPRQVLSTFAQRMIVQPRAMPHRIQSVQCTSY